MDSRRSALLKLLSGAAAGFLRPARAMARVAPDSLIAPFAAGSEIAFGWRVASLSNVVDGAAMLTLTHDAIGDARLRVCVRDPHHRLGIAQTRELDLVLINEGGPTEPTLAAAVEQLASTIAASERRSSLHEALRTHDEHLRLCDV